MMIAWACSARGTRSRSTVPPIQVVAHTSPGRLPVHPLLLRQALRVWNLTLRLSGRLLATHKTSKTARGRLIRAPAEVVQQSRASRRKELGTKMGRAMLAGAVVLALAVLSAAVAATAEGPIELIGADEVSAGSQHCSL